MSETLICHPLKLRIMDEQPLQLGIVGDGSLGLGLTTPITEVQTGDYDKLANKPSIEGHLLEGDSTIGQIGVGTLTVQDIEKILYLD